MTAVLEDLAEGQVIEDLDLSIPQAAALNSSRLVTVQPGERRWRVTAAHAVGAVQVDGLVVRVRPKVGALQVLRLLARARGMRNLYLDDAPVHLDTAPDLTAVLALLFADEADTAMALGPLRGYREEEQLLPVLRGRLRLREQHTLRFGLLHPLEVTVDEWTTDTDENRRIRAAARQLITLVGVPDVVRRRLIRLDRQLADVTVQPAGTGLPLWTATRLNVRLHHLLGLADLVLANQTIEHRVGGESARGFVVRMESLFENLVQQILTEHDDDVRLHPQANYRLDTLKRLTIRPDLVFLRAGQAVAVADTKYKILKDDGRMRNEDGYQLITYCRRLGLSEGHLIYAAGPVLPAPFEIPQAEVTLYVHRIDMDQPIAGIEHDLWRLREQVLAPAMA